MLAIWNRKEVMLTNDMERLAKARYALQGAGIVYTCLLYTSDAADE